jgi:hypothetical protein
MKYKIGDKVKLLPLNKLMAIPNWQHWVDKIVIEEMAGKEYEIYKIEPPERRIGSHYHPSDMENTIPGTYSYRFDDEWIDDKPKTLRGLIE